MTRPLRIAIELGSRLFGGAERELARVGRALAGRGHAVLFFCNPEHVEPLRAAGLETRLHRLGGDASVHHVPGFARALRHWRPDALVVGTFKKVWLAGLAARLARVPRVVARVVLETDVPRNLKYRIAFAGLVDHIAVNARSMEAPFLALPGWSERRVTTIYNLYPLPAAGSVDPALELGGAPVVGAVSRLARQKRLERLIEAVAPLEQVHCVIAGEGEERERLTAAAARLGGRVHLLGHREDVPAVLAALDVFVICSDREGMSNAMVEALAAGVPVVSTPVSGAHEALEPLDDGVAAGIVTSDFTVDSLRTAMGGLLRDDALRARMAEAAVRIAKERFSPERAVQAWERVLTPVSRR